MARSTPLSEREEDVIRLLLQGKGNKQIALDLGISSRTVEFHLSNIYSKLGVASRSEAILKLTGGHLWRSAGGHPVESTVDSPGDFAENGSTSILRRIPVKRHYLILSGLAIVLIAAIAIFRLSGLGPSSRTTLPFELTPISNLLGAAPTVTPAPTLAGTTVAPAEADPADPPEIVVIPSHTVNGLTATIESYYVDTSHVLFQVRIVGGEVAFGDGHYYDRIQNAGLYTENGEPINTSGGWGPAVDPELYQFEFVPVTLLKGDRFSGQFAFDVTAAPDATRTLAQFRFDLDLPIYPEARFYPKQTVTASGVEMLLDSVTVTPVFTQLYLCFAPPSFAPWMIGSQAVLQIGEQEALLYNSRLLFGSDLGGDRRAGSEPYWAPPTKHGRCLKIGFPVGDNPPTSLTLTIPGLEEESPDVLMTDRLAADYPGLDPGEAYHAYLEEHGHTYRGPWVFTVDLKP